MGLNLQYMFKEMPLLNKCLPCLDSGVVDGNKCLGMASVNTGMMMDQYTQLSNHITLSVNLVTYKDNVYI